VRDQQQLAPGVPGVKELRQVDGGPAAVLGIVDEPVPLGEPQGCLGSQLPGHGGLRRQAVHEVQAPLAQHAEDDPDRAPLLHELRAHVVVHPPHMGNGLQVLQQGSSNLLRRHGGEEGSAAGIPVGEPVGFHGKVQKNLTARPMGRLGGGPGVGGVRQDREGQGGLDGQQPPQRLGIVTDVVDENGDSLCPGMPPAVGSRSGPLRGGRNRGLPGRVLRLRSRGPAPPPALRDQQQGDQARYARDQENEGPRRPRAPRRPSFLPPLQGSIRVSQFFPMRLKTSQLLRMSMALLS